jgi:hypothetical protein
MVSQTDRVLNCLRKYAYREFTAKTISRIVKVNENKVKVYLNRLHNKGLILRTTKGLYKAIADVTVLRQQQLTNPPTLLHGILLECRLLPRVTKHPQGTPPKGGICYVDSFIKKWLLAHGFGFRDDNGSWCRFLWWESRRVSVSLFGNGKLEVYVSSSKNPLSYPEFELLLSFLDGFFMEVAPFKDRRVVRLKEVGLAKDFKELRLEGVKSVSLRAFKNSWARIYYKDDQQLVRVEHHLALDMSLDEALKSLSILTNPVNYESIVLSGRVDEKRDVA